MSARRTERLLNLTICLMAGRRPLSKSEIRGLIGDYRDSVSDEAFERMFERDKDDLREMGIPLVTENIDPLFDDEPGYRIDPSAYAMPEIEVGPDEMAVLTLAARAWQQAALAPAATAALRKVEAYAADHGEATFEPEALGLEPRLSTSEIAFAPLYEAVRDRRPVRFTYRTPGTPAPVERHVEPWGVVSWHGRWYVAGHDRDRDATRVFRLSRIEGDVAADGPNGSVVVPPGVDAAAAVQMVAPDAAERIARVEVAPDTAHALRTSATSVTPQPGGSEILEVPFGDLEAFAADVIAADGVVLEPPELRAAAVLRLRGVLASTGAGTAS